VTVSGVIDVLRTIIASSPGLRAIMDQLEVITMTSDEQLKWEPWQEEYRHGAFYLFPPPEIALVVNELRRRYDPRSAAICDARVSLSEPLAGPLLDEQLEELRAALCTIAPFHFTLSPLTQMGSHPGVVLGLSPEEPFFALRDVVHSTSIFAGRELSRAQRSPHMTVAEFVSQDEAQSLLAEVSPWDLGASFLCDHLVYAVPDVTFHFEPVLTLTLGSLN
jgi:2'-5' RNA ligase